MQSIDSQSCGLCTHFRQRIPGRSLLPDVDSLEIIAILNTGVCSRDDEEVAYDDHGCPFHVPVFEICPV